MVMEIGAYIFRLYISWSTIEFYTKINICAKIIIFIFSHTLKMQHHFFRNSSLLLIISHGHCKTTDIYFFLHPLLPMTGTTKSVYNQIHDAWQLNISLQNWLFTHDIVVWCSRNGRTGFSRRTKLRTHANIIKNMNHLNFKYYDSTMLLK